MWEVLEREFIYIWYYFTVQLEQIFGWWVLGMVIGSAVSVFAKDYIHRAFRSLQGKKLGILGIVAASALGIASPLCMYGTIPIAASFSKGGMKDSWLAAFMMASILTDYRIDCKPDFVNYTDADYNRIRLKGTSLTVPEEMKLDVDLICCWLPIGYARIESEHFKLAPF